MIVAVWILGPGDNSFVAEEGSESMAQGEEGCLQSD